MTALHQSHLVLPTRVPEEVYTDRREFLDYFYDLALKAKTQRAMSTVLLGQRRMGKTEILIRVVNERQGELVRQEHRGITLTLWMFAYSGLTPEAEAYAKERGILWSALPEFNELLEHLGLRHLPELSEENTTS